MTATIPELPWCYNGDDVILPPWWLEGPDKEEMVLASLTAFSFTIRKADGTAVGAEDRNGLNTGGVNITVDGEVFHEVEPADSTLTVATEGEKRYIVYKATFTDGDVVKTVREYVIRPSVP